MTLPTAKDDPLVSGLKDLEKLTAAVKSYFGERMGEREIEIERFDLERGEGVYNPELVAIACAVTDTSCHEELLYKTLHEERDADAIALTKCIAALAYALEQAQGRR